MKITKRTAVSIVATGLIAAATMLAVPLANATTATGCQTFPDRNYCVYNANGNQFVSIAAFNGRVSASKSDGGNTWLDSNVRNHVAAGPGRVETRTNAPLKWRACAWFEQGSALPDYVGCTPWVQGR